MIGLRDAKNLAFGLGSDSTRRQQDKKLLAKKEPIVMSMRTLNGPFRVFITVNSLSSQLNLGSGLVWFFMDFLGFRSVYNVVISERICLPDSRSLLSAIC